MRAIGYQEKDGTAEAVFRLDQLRAGWTYHAGESIPGPDEKTLEVERRLEAEIIADIKALPRWVARRIEIDNEVRNG